MIASLVPVSSFVVPSSHRTSRRTHQVLPSPSSPTPTITRTSSATPSADGTNGKSDNTAHSTILSQAALIAGTTIGGGFLALPAATSPCGALPAALGLVAVWLFLLGTALSFANSIFIMKNGNHSDDDTTGSSIFSLVLECFGSTAGFLSGLLFVLLINATLIAQLSKVGVLLEGASFLPAVLDRRGCSFLFSVIIGALCLSFGRSRKMERINDALTTTMLVSFASLVGLAGGNGWSIEGLKRADFRSLLPPLSFLSSAGRATGKPWAIPIFIQLLIYNEVVPLVSSRLGDEKKVRKAIVLGSSVPLMMCLVWSCVALGLVPYEPSLSTTTIYDPLSKLGDTVLKGDGSRMIGKVFLASVNTLAGSAICTTVVGSILASTQYFDDLIGNLFETKERDSDTDKQNNAEVDVNNKPVNNTDSFLRQLVMKHRKFVTHFFAITPSAVIAIRGSSELYYHATRFAGEFPCTLLYGFIPPLCNLRLQWKQRKSSPTVHSTNELRGIALQIGLSVLSLSILVVSRLQ